MRTKRKLGIAIYLFHSALFKEIVAMEDLKKITRDDWIILLEQTDSLCVSIRHEV